MTQQADAGLNLQHFKELKQDVNTEIQTYALALKKETEPHFRKEPQCENLNPLFGLGLLTHSLYFQTCLSK